MDFGDTNSTLHCVFWDHDLFQGSGKGEMKGARCRWPMPAPHCLFHPNVQTRCFKTPTLELLSHVGLGASIPALLMCLGMYRLV